MDLDCLIKLLLEKKIIKHAQRDRTVDGEVIISTYEYKYKEVFQKIIESRYDKTQICIEKVACNMFCVLNINNLEKGLISISKGSESFVFSKSRYGLQHFPYKKLKEVIDEKTRFYVMRDSSMSDALKVIDGYIEAERIEKEFNRKNEVLDFLNQLP